MEGRDFDFPGETYNEVEWAEGLELFELERMNADGVFDTVDGCRVEPDGTCPHGFRSPLIIMGMI